MSRDRRQGGLLGALAALLVLALLIAGCGGSGGSSSGGSTAAGGAASELAGAAAVAKAEEFGSEASGSKAKQPEAALKGYLDARVNGEWSKACSYLSKELRKFYGRVSKGDCTSFVEKATERLSASERAALAEVEVGSVRLEGDSGYVVYADAEGSQQAKPIVREGGAWKVSSPIIQLLEQAKKK